GLRWDYFPPADEPDGLLAEPIVQNGNVPQTLLGNATIDLVGSAVGRPLYKKDKNNFAPNVALAWDPFGKGKTSIRAGFNIAFLNDNTLNSVYNALTINNGLSSSPSIGNLVNTFADAPTPVPVPKFGLPTTTLDQFVPSSPPVEGLIDPNLATPYAEQWNFDIQHEVRGGWIFEGRYVGNHVVKGLRQIDFNQINIFQADFLPDFI